MLPRTWPIQSMAFHAFMGNLKVQKCRKYTQYVKI